MFVTAIICGSSLGYYQGDPLKLIEDCQVLKPTFFPSVPRIYNKIYAMIKAKLGPNVTPPEGAFNQILGGRVRVMASGSAPISKEVLDLLRVAFGCPMLEGYGLSETCGAVTAMKANDTECGTIGGPYRHCAIRLKDLPEMGYRITDQPYPRGEICVRTPSLTSGYFMRPDKTAEAIDE